MKVKFICPECEGTHLEEVMLNVVQYTTVLNVVKSNDSSVDCTYGHNNCEDGNIERYQCADCGHQIAYDEFELFDFLETNNMLE